jgi:hypothetical protein
MIYFYFAADFNHVAPDDLEQRLGNEASAVGSWTWMDPRTKKTEWEVIATHPFRSGDVEVTIVEVAKGPVEGSAIPSGIHLFFLEGKIYTYHLIGGTVLAPDLGDFVEYEYGTIRTLPVTKTVSRYAELSGDGPCKVYAAHLLPVLIPVAV